MIQLKPQWPFHVLNRKNLISGLLLTYVGGFLDGYTYLGKGHVFANAQTGNIALLGISLFQGKPLQVLNYLLPIVAFAIGSFLAKRIARTSRAEHMTALLEIVILAAVATAGSHLANQYGNMLISFVCALQVTAFRQIDGLPYASTMCTGNLRSAMEKFELYLTHKEPQHLKHAMKYLLVISCFVIGAGCSSIVLSLWGLSSLYLACVILLINVIFL